MTPCLALDLSCIALAPFSRTPRGIDRVELAYARHFLNHWPGECVAVLPEPWGIRCYKRDRALTGIRAIEEIWREGADPSQDRTYTRTKQFLAGAPLTDSEPSPESGWRKAASVASKYRTFFAHVGFTFGRSVARAVPRGTIYLNVGQLEVFRTFVSWLYRRPDVVATFMMHDVIPIELPAHHTPALVRSHRAIVRNVAEFAHGLIVPSAAAKAAVLGEMARCGRPEIRTHVELLPVPSEFLVREERDPDLPAQPYFLACGVVDAHKNHLTLLQAWRELVGRRGASAPKLVIVGSLGITSGPTIEFLNDCAAIRPHVLISSGLSTPALRRLMKGATALLMPSIAEGFGLPIVEGLAQRTPVIASDIPAHREAGAGGDVTYVEATNPTAWLAAIETRLNAPAGRSATPYRPKTWPDYFAGIEGFLAELSRNPARPR